MACSLARPTNGMVRRADRIVSPSIGKASRPESKPLALIWRRRPYETVAAVRAWVVTPASSSLGRAADCSRDARLTTGPVTSIWPLGFRPMAASPDSDLERRGKPRRLPQPVRSGANGKPGPDRAQGIVLVDGRQAEDSHHRVADELLGPAAEREPLLSRVPEELAQHLPGSLSGESGREAGRVDNVGAEDGDPLPFLRAGQGSDRRAAVRAEPGGVRERTAANRAGQDHICRICCSR